MSYKILIYNDKGVSSTSAAHIKKELMRYPTLSVSYINAEEICDGKWEQAQALFVPGGADIPYHEALRGVGNKNIQTFVQEGGTYYGICAGAYYGCASIEFEKGFKNEVIGERELQFFQGVAVGTLFSPGSYSYHSDRGARDAQIAYGGQEHTVHYHGGCTFSGEDSSSEVLARYSELPGSPPAIIKCQVGKGAAILSGVHYEYSDHGEGNGLFRELLVESDVPLY